MKTVAIVAFVTLCSVAIAVGQTETATISGRVADPSGAAISGAGIQIQNVLTGQEVATKTNGSGLYVATALQPGTYRLIVSNPGFKQIVKPDVVLNVQDNASLNFSMTVGSVSETVIVTGGTPLVNTQDATVSTVVDRNFAENIPLNGRSFQTLIELTPGVVLTTSNFGDGGQFSVNGQRASSNYWMVDGVGANIGTSSGATPGNGLGGALGSFSVLGGTNSLVSVDALQEFRIQTSTYAPEFGRTPGAQISILTRSGTNQFHGTVFDYLRNDVLDANDWFAANEGLAKPQERQNDFGGTFSGPILRDRTFFFFSYEGFRLRLPQVGQSTVPSLSARQNATAEMRPYLDAFPLPNPSATDVNGISPFAASFSNSASLDAYSIRIDHNLHNKINIFGRYDYSPSDSRQRGGSSYFSLSTVNPSTITTQTGTIGATWLISPTKANDLRFNYSQVEGTSSSSLDTFGGAIPLSSNVFPDPFTERNAQFRVVVTGLAGNAIQQGFTIRNLQRQFNLVESFSVQAGSHALKVGADFRRLSPIYNPPSYSQLAYFSDVVSAENGSFELASIISSLPTNFLLHNLGVFLQDTWRVAPRLTVTYGVRWDIDWSPTTASGPNIPGVVGFNLVDLSQLALAPAGTPPFRTTFGNIGPRVGVAYQLTQTRGWDTVVRGGIGQFFDLATQETGNSIYFYSYPFGAQNVVFGGTFPLSSANAAPPPITPPGPTSVLAAFDPNLKLPYTWQWNTAVEQSLGEHQALSASYVGSVGRKLIQTALVYFPNPNLGVAQLVTNAGTSDYHALQLQFQRKLTRGLQALASYTWSHSIDTGSAGSIAVGSNTALAPGATNRGPSDFDIRHAFSTGVTYELHPPKTNRVADVILNGWALQTVVQARSEPPVDVYNSNYFLYYFTSRGFSTNVRPDLVPGIPLYSYGSQYPGGKAFNSTPNQGGLGCSGPFCPPPTDPNTGIPLRQGNLPRNAMRGFGATEWDFALHRTFGISERVSLQFRTEIFNILNHPNFGPPTPDLANTLQFGQATQMLGRSLGDQNVGAGGFAALYQIGGPRSIQFGLKLTF